jgi:hypothetical protein
MNKKLALLLLTPLVASFMLVPLATATSSKLEVNIYVGCYSNADYNQRAWASLTYDGHTIAIICTPGVENSVSTNVWVGNQASFTATVFAQGHHYTETGKFGVNNDGSSIYGKQDGSESYAYFDLNADVFCTCVG